MAMAVGWLERRDEIKALLQEVHRARHNAGREETRLRKIEAERLRQTGREKRADALDEREWKKGIAFARRRRLREEFEASKGRKRIRAVVPEDERLRSTGRCPAALFKQFEAKRRSGDGGLRDLYYDVISRGLHSGRAKDYKRYVKRSSARTTRWKSGEMGRKVRYIVRADALEQVEGNVLTNMGDTIEEAIGCTRAIEQIEKMSRDNAGVYKHVIVGLPHHLSAVDRAQLLSELTKPLRKMRLPFAASLHKPDARGDQRNFHVHIIVSLRPMERLGDHQWEFEAGKSTWLDTSAAIRLQRRFVAAAFNRALAAAGETVRWTGKSRAARGEKSPGNTKRSQEGNRVQRAEQDLDSAASAAIGDLSFIEELDHDLAGLHRTLGDLGRVSYNFDRVAGRALAEISRLHAFASDQVSELEELAAAHENLRSSVEADERRSGRMISADEESPTAGADAPPETEAISTDAFAELRRFQIEQEEGASKHRSPTLLRQPPTLTTELALADAAARFEMEQAWDCVDDQALARVRSALLSSPPSLFAAPLDSARYQFFAYSDTLFHDLAAVCQSDAGCSYLRLVVDDAALPPAALELKSIILTRKDRVGVEQGTIEKLEPMEEHRASPVAEDHIPFDLQAAFLSDRGFDIS